MRKIFILILLSVFITQYLDAKNTGSDKMNYAVSLIPAELRNEAKAVVRLKSVRFEVEDNESAVKKVRFAVTIFNKDKRDEGFLYLYHDKFHEIEELEGTIYDENGSVVRELDDDDIKDFSAYSSYSLYEDSRRRSAELYYDKYPYTVEYYYEISYDGYLDWPDWYAQTSLDPVQKSSFEILLPANKKLRYWCNNDSIKPKITNVDDDVLYSWEMSDLPKLSRDVVGDDIEDVTTIVYTAPDKFEIEDHPGDMTSWNNFGNWIYNLYKGKEVLPETAKQEINSLIKPGDNTIQKIKELYRYMQSRTRYVSIQLGLGGWEPYDATFVHEHGYGDCKALSNYMTAILKEAGINSYYVLIRNGDYRYPMITDFPSNQFNHVIVCVPVEKDTVWLECTSQTMPFNHVGRGSENRHALMITPHGGVVVNTPVSKPEENSQYRKAFVDLSSSGHAKVNASVTWKGNQEDRIRFTIEEKSPEEKRRWVVNSIDVPNLTLKNYAFSGIETPEDSIKLNTDCLIQRYGSVTGSRIFFQPNMMEKRSYIPPKVDERLSPVRFYYPFHDVDTVVYSIPKEYGIEMLPAETHLTTSFGEFISKSELTGGNKIIFTRSLIINEYSIPAESYPEYRQFISEIVKADKMQVVLVKKKM